VRTASTIDFAPPVAFCPTSAWAAGSLLLKIAARPCGRKDVNARMSSRASRETPSSRDRHPAVKHRGRSHALPIAPWPPLFRAQRQGLNCH
jgi:hypothetical protein